MHRVHRQPVDLVPMKGRLLALILAQGIGILRLDRVVLGRGGRCQPIAGGGRSIDELRDAGRTRAFQHVHRALDVRRHVFHRPLDGRHDVADAREMEHVVHTRKQRVAGLVGADVGGFEGEIRVALVVGDIGLPAAHQIVDDADFVALADQQVDHVAADEASSPRNHGDLCGPRHLAPIFFIVLTLKYQSSSKLFGSR